MRDALLEPRPVQTHLPILIGGSGPQKTLRTVARYADGWNTSGSLDDVRRRSRSSRACADVGPRPGEIERTVSFPIVIRDDAADARRHSPGCWPTTAPRMPAMFRCSSGRRELVADGIRPYRDELGFGHVIARHAGAVRPRDDRATGRGSRGSLDG